VKLVSFTPDWQEWFCRQFDDPEEKHKQKIPIHMDALQILNILWKSQEVGQAGILGAIHDGGKAGYMIFDEIDIKNRRCVGHFYLAPNRS
jgi:hypothetical protein